LSAIQKNSSPVTGLLIAASLVLATTACSDASDDGAGAATGTHGATPYVRPGLQAAFVTHVTDGDTVRVEIDGEEYRVRYIGIDAPETDPVECLAAEATERNRDLVDGETVGLEADVSETDRFGRLLRYVWLGDQMINVTLVRDGFAEERAYPPDVSRQEAFREAEQGAQVDGLGIWGPDCAGGP
jgi:endonuclease YncB( thermonuclease family)